MADHINWIPTQYGGYTGHVGTFEPWLFMLRRNRVEWVLSPALPGMAERTIRDDDPRSARPVPTLKAEAERWLEEFVSSLGAIFPDEVFDFGDDGEPLEVKYAPGSRVRFEHPGYGYPGEQGHAAEHLTVGEVYTIAMFQIGQSRTDLILEGIPGEWFNSVFFETADDEER